MKKFELKYGCNPNQKPAWLDRTDGADLPFAILNGRPGYINFMDALNSWQLVKELKEATGMPCATSFKHVSPTSAAVGKVLPLELKKACFVADVKGLDENPLACAYVRARGTDRMCSFGDWVALSDICDELTASLIAPEVSDGVIAPGYTDKALEILKTKRKGGYNVVTIDPDFVPTEQETKEIFGIAFHQGRNNFEIDADLLANIVTENKELPESAKIDLIVALITLKYTQSNSVCYAVDGQAIGVGPVSSPASTAPVWQVLRRIPGSCGSTPRLWRCLSGQTWAGQTGTMSSTAISTATKKMSALTAFGKTISPSSLTG